MIGGQGAGVLMDWRWNFFLGGILSFLCLALVASIGGWESGSVGGEDSF